MDQLYSFDALLFPSDGRPPHVVALMTSPASFTDPHSLQMTANVAQSRVPHPEVYMDYIAEIPGQRAWNYQLVEALDGMNKKFTNPYIIFYPVHSRDMMPFPVNKSIREIQGKGFREDLSWRGNIIIAKYRDGRFSAMMNASMADFPILKNYLSTHRSPIRVSEAPSSARRVATSFAEPVPSTTEAEPPASEPGPSTK
ncbi:hypothetical protein EWM64_g2540 [Hericium alpestre]|uniref:Uncharacterized protein n=1 Tax=Hericium alpestre TaxID=135208 RepID=A0A4Z0A5F5_9AGAM|nr:hypothetical protein EWM64_g2540 [Hericium alpestre]